MTVGLVDSPNRNRPFGDLLHAASSAVTNGCHLAPRNLCCSSEMNSFYIWLRYWAEPYKIA
jgi:hypothetical protein